MPMLTALAPLPIAVPPAVRQGALAATRAAGVWLRQRQERATGAAYLGKDVKLEADVQAENLLRQHLGQVVDATGQPYPVIGEELGGDIALLQAATPAWVVDPLDGTYNYGRAWPATCVSLAWVVGDRPLYGVVYDFERDELWSGVPGKGLLCNGQPVAPAWATTPGRACLCTGFPAGRDFGTAALAAFVGRVQRYQKVRMVGSAALALTWVAAGRADAYLEEGGRWWDVAGGLALLLAAGGVAELTWLPGAKPFSLTVAAAGSPALLPT